MKMPKRVKNCDPQPGVCSCSSRVYWGCVVDAGDDVDGAAVTLVFAGAADTVPVAENAERVSFDVSWLDGACSGDGGSSCELKPSMRHRTITSSWQARDRIRSPKKATLCRQFVSLGAREQTRDDIPVYQARVDFGRGKMRVVHDKRRRDVLFGKVRKRPLGDRGSASRRRNRLCAFVSVLLTRLITWSCPADKT